MSLVKKTNYILQEFSIPLLFGVVVALLWANYNYATYEHFTHFDLLNGEKFLGHTLTPHFIINDIFMVFFFGLAGVEIANAFKKGGPLNPISKAISPIAGTLGGVLTPIVIFFIFLGLFRYQSLEGFNQSEILNGWAIPTATDIALAWLLAKIVFGKNHPAISFLLLLAVGDDAIGLIIIAVFYPSPEYPPEPAFLIINLLAITIAFLLRKNNVRRVSLYIILAGIPSWLGFILAHLHPALALVPIVFFLPTDKKAEEKASPLINFENTFKNSINLGLFFFSLMNAGVVFSNINALTWVVLLSLKIGKTLGIFSFSYAAHLMGFNLPDKIARKELIMIGLIGSLGLTVSLFVAGQAYQNPILQGGAKMGALLSLIAIPLASLMAKILKIKKLNKKA